MKNFVMHQNVIISELNRSLMFSKQFLPIVIYTPQVYCTLSLTTLDLPIIFSCPTTFILKHVQFWLYHFNALLCFFQHHELLNCNVIKYGLFCWFEQLCCIPRCIFKWFQSWINIGFKTVLSISCNSLQLCLCYVSVAYSLM